MLFSGLSTSGGSSSPGGSNQQIIQTPFNEAKKISWNDVIARTPDEVGFFFIESVTRKFVLQGKLFLPAYGLVKSSSLRLKALDSVVPKNIGVFRAIIYHRIGQPIIYNPALMSIFNPGNGTLKSTQLPSALFEVARFLDAAENARNGANPGLPPQRNLSTTVSFDSGTISIAATIPIVPEIDPTDGSIDVRALNYLGTPFGTFDNGGGQLKSDTIPEAFLEIASILAAAEKQILPAEVQPNNIQIVFDLETGSATVSANMPFNSEQADDGDVVIHAIDYL